MGRKKSRVMFAPNPQALRDCSWHLLSLSAWYEELLREAGIAGFSDGQSDECLELMASSDREALRIIEDAVRHVRGAMEALLDVRHLEDFCWDWVNFLVPKYEKVNSGRLSQSRLRAMIRMHLRFSAGNCSMYAPATVRDGKSKLSDKNGRFRSMPKSSTAMRDACRELGLSADQILGIGPKKAAYESVAVYIGSNAKTVERNFRRAEVRRSNGNRSYWPMFPLKSDFLRIISQLRTSRRNA